MQAQASSTLMHSRANGRNFGGIFIQVMAAAQHGLQPVLTIHGDGDFKVYLFEKALRKTLYRADLGISGDCG